MSTAEKIVAENSACTCSLTSPNPPDSGQPEEQCNKENDRHSLAAVKTQAAVTAYNGDKALAELANYLSVHLTQVSEGSMG